MLGKGPGNGGVGLFFVDLSVQTKEYAVSRIHEREAQILSQKPGGEILTAAYQLIHAHILAEPGTQPAQIGFQIILQAQGIPNLTKALLYCMQDVLAGDAVGQMRMAEIEQIGKLVIVAETFSRGGRDDNAARGITFNNGFYFLKLFGARHGGAAELGNFYSHFILLWRRKRPLRLFPAVL